MNRDVDWSRCEEHLWLRHRVLLRWAMEAWNDPYRFIQDPDPASRSGQSMRVLGYSPTNQCVIAIIAVKHESSLVIATAWKANATQSSLYQQLRVMNGPSNEH